MAQAAAFARRYEVLRVFDDTTNGITGAYAVLFEENGATGRVTLAVRGTDGAGDSLLLNCLLDGGAYD